MSRLKLFIALIILTTFNSVYSENEDCSSINFFDCGNGRCVASFWRCDGENDCGNLADEHGCEHDKPSEVVTPMKIACPKDYHYCNDSNGTCIPDKWKCNGIKDCENGSDEKNCTRSSLGHLCIKERGFYQCITGECISHEKVCDEKKDCPQGDDEGSECKSGRCHKKECAHFCMPTPRGAQCYCKDGFRLGKDEKSCEDVNECEEGEEESSLSHHIKLKNDCSHICHNYKGGYKCDCFSGYKLVNGTRCVVDSGEPVMIFSDGAEIRGLWLDSNRYFLVHPAVKQTVGVDIYGDQEKVFWVDLDASHSGVYSANLMGDESEMKAVVTTGLKSPEDIAVDWIGNNLYITDADAKKIVACKLDGSICTSLIIEGINLPRAIAVDPMRGILFWTEWGKNPGIFSSWMDGTHRDVIAKDDVVWPNGLTLDVLLNRVYWSDAKLIRIEYYDMRTHKRKVLLQDSVFHPFSLSVFEDTLYWADWVTYSIDSCNKLTGRNQSEMLRLNGQHIMGLKVYHPVMQRQTYNPCQTHQCSHLCLLIPGNMYSCACPDHMYLSVDNVTCILKADKLFLMVGMNNTARELHPEIIGSQEIADCNEGKSVCKNGKHCILEEWICDGQVDCEDGSDETDCHEKCPENDFACDNGKCIVAAFRCDNVDDCGDSSDESDCPGAPECSEGSFRCSDGICIPENFKCDGKADCKDADDEIGCRNVTDCQNDPIQMSCGDGKCIPLHWVCDGESDCHDSRDESTCHENKCKPNEFGCRHKDICIDKQFVCDKEKDCADGSDEENCQYEVSTCPPYKYTCESDGHCIHYTELCDGLHDCLDGDDEVNCQSFSCESETDTWCSNSSVTCIPKIWLCDGENDCGNWEDELRTECNK